MLLTEWLFGIRGIGSVYFLSVMRRDVPIVEFLLTITFFVMLVVAILPAQADRSPGAGLWTDSSHWLARVGVRVAIGLVAALVLVAMVGPFLGTESGRDFNATTRLQGPSLDHLFGTTRFGQDVLARTVEGARAALEFAGIVLGFGFVAGIIAGTLASVRAPARWFVARVSVHVPSLPVLLIILAVAMNHDAMLGALAATSFMAFLAGLGLSLSVPFADGTDIRRSAASALSNAIRPAAELAAFAIVTHETIAFLHVGVEPGNPTWGADIADGAGAFSDYPRLFWVPVGALFVLLFALNLIATCSCGARIQSEDEPPASSAVSAP